MKKSVFIAIALIASVSSFALYAVPVVPSTVTVNGTVLPVLSVQVSNPEVGIKDLLDSGGKIDLGTVTFISNYKAWQVTFSSANAGKMVSTDKEIKDSISYTFIAEGVLEGRLEKEITRSYAAKTAKLGDIYAMLIKYDPNSAVTYLTSGTYTDTITITVAPD
jgi:hypothetical protein